VLAIPGAAASPAVASRRYGVGVDLGPPIVPAVLLTSPDHGDGVHGADTPGLPANRQQSRSGYSGPLVR
jgi:hypothetical protein